MLVLNVPNVPNVLNIQMACTITCIDDILKVSQYRWYRVEKYLNQNLSPLEIQRDCKASAIKLL